MSKCSEEQVKHAFDKFDSDKSGAIKARELLNVLEDLGMQGDDAKACCGAILKECDKDEDGVITLDEFKRTYFSS